MYNFKIPCFNDLHFMFFIPFSFTLYEERVKEGTYNLDVKVNDRLVS